MNQILENKNIEWDVNAEFSDELSIFSSTFQKQKKKKIFQLVFLLCVLLSIALFLFFMYRQYDVSRKEKISNQLLHNYGTLKLYAETTPFDPFSKNLAVEDSENSENFILGIIEIPSLHISYPFFSHLGDSSLQVSPCRFSGVMPPVNSNLCIAGHNYDNGKFFSLISTLKKEDQIYIYDMNNQKYIYNIFSIYEVKDDNLSPLSYASSNQFELTLVTCNNLNQNRIIVKASF